MARRKRLIGLDALTRGNELLDMGVTMKRVHEELALEWSYVSTRDVFHADREGLHSVTRPEWLQETPDLQETPEDYVFVGTFPIGDWYKTKA